MFKESDKVVCIDSDSKGEVYSKESFPKLFEIVGGNPKRNQIYVVQRVFSHTGFVGLGLILVGSSCIHKPSNIECGWNSRYFRKLEEIQAENRAKQTSVNHV